MSTFLDFTISENPNLSSFLVGYTQDSAQEQAFSLQTLKDLFGVKDFDQTWNSASLLTGLTLNITDTLSDSASILLDLKVDTVSKFKVSKSGILTLGNTLTLKYVSFEGSESLQLGTDSVSQSGQKVIKSYDVSSGVGGPLGLSGGDGSAGDGPVNILTRLVLPSLTYAESILDPITGSFIIISDAFVAPVVGTAVTAGSGAFGALCLCVDGEYIAVSNLDVNYVA